MRFYEKMSREKEREENLPDVITPARKQPPPFRVIGTTFSPLIRCLSELLTVNESLRSEIRDPSRDSSKIFFLPPASVQVAAYRRGSRKRRALRDAGPERRLVSLKFI